MRAVLIDAKLEQVRAIELDMGAGYLDQMYKLLDCHTICAGPGWPMPYGRDLMFLDDLGMYHKQYGFFWEGYPHALYGNAVVMGADHAGEEHDAETSVAGIHFGIRKFWRR